MDTEKAYHPGNPKQDIEDIGEKALQRAIFNGLSTSLPSGVIINWLDYELPVSKAKKGKARGKCLDLIGKDSEGRYVICELKFARRGRGDSPSKADGQVLHYKELLEKNELFAYHRFVTEKFDLDLFVKRRPRLIVAANSRYWDIHKRHSLSLKTGVEHYAIEVSPDEFVEQKGNRKEYRPKPPRNGLEWSIIRCQ